MASYAHLAMDNGMTLAQLAFCLGWSSAGTARPIVRDAFEKRLK